MARAGSSPPASAPDLAAEADRLAGFVDGQSAIVLAVTPEEQTLPEIGTLPFVRHEGAFWVLASELAAHTRPLLKRGEARVALLADQSDTRNSFARERAHWAARVEAVDRADERFAVITAALRARHGKTVEVLCGLGDFHLLGLHPEGGSYVNGFGRAFLLDGFSVVAQRRG
ncbi:HugZ family protein [Guyparkeria sp. SB14A]|uniref:HugZ family protein n=1 Tax=Guyparkeria sp. SB14A TaxID=2571147 RepID=UPI0010ACDC71|nr:HugZ family protein [Guyparkeria sp. SB14A]TKA90544.1 HugZ family protein [Guyparkeria sp. SB14A]